MQKTVFLYGILLAFLILLINTAEYIFWIRLHLIEIYFSIIAVIFLIIGLLFGKNSEEKAINDLNFESKEYQINDFGISKREFEVLKLVSQGLSNQQIADNLFVSNNTIKTHTSRLFTKLEVRNRTQALLKAKKLGLIV